MGAAESRDGGLCPERGRPGPGADEISEESGPDPAVFREKFMHKGEKTEICEERLFSPDFGGTITHGLTTDLKRY